MKEKETRPGWKNNCAVWWWWKCKVDLREWRDFGGTHTVTSIPPCFRSLQESIRVGFLYVTCSAGSMLYSHKPFNLPWFSKARNGDCASSHSAWADTAGMDVDIIQAKRFGASFDDFSTRLLQGRNISFLLFLVWTYMAWILALRPAQSIVRALKKRAHPY